MFTAADAQHLESVRSRTAAGLQEILGSQPDVALLDAPVLLNVGDSMIWSGQLEYMKRLGRSIRYFSDMQSFDKRRLTKALPNGGTVLLRGGGNFGDIWAGHQRFRERVLRELREYHVVQLPQSIYFEDTQRAVSANRELSAHPNFQVLVRDSLSAARAADLLPDVTTRLSFDMALGWEPPAPQPRSKESDAALIIARSDKEASSGLLAAASEWEPSYPMMLTDWTSHNEHPQKWHDTRERLRRNGNLLARKRLARLLPTLSQRQIEGQISYLNNWNLEWAVELFSHARAIVVDRLHAHVLAVLLGIPHVVLDNNHGKISAVVNAYTSQFSTVHLAESTDEAHFILDKLMA